MAVIGELATLITAHTEPFSNGLKSAGMAANSFTGTIKNRLGSALGGLTGMLSGATAAMLGLGGALSAGGLVAKSLQMASAAEDMETAYATYLKSAEKARDTLAELQKYSSTTPFESTEIKEAGKQLLAFGFDASELMEKIYVLGDLAAGSQKPMADFVDILGKIRASGVASMGDVNRLADRGVPIFQELSKVMGVASNEVRDLVGSSKVGFTEVWEALKNVVGEGGLFEGAVAKLAETTSGKLTTLQDNINELFTKVGKAILDGLELKTLVVRLTELVETYGTHIVDATVKGVELMMSALETAPSWFKKLERFWAGLEVASGYGAGMTAFMPGSWPLFWGAMGKNPLDMIKLGYETSSRGLDRYQQMEMIDRYAAMNPNAIGKTPAAATPSAQPRQQTRADTWSEQDIIARRQWEIYVQQLAEQRRTNQLIHEQTQMWRAYQQPVVVDHF